MLSSISGTNSTSFTYTYDGYGNILTEKEVGIDSKWLQKNYSYINGRITGTTYVSQTETIASENYTYTNNHLKTVKIGNVPIWDLQAIDVFGHPTKIVTGNITRNYTYDGYGFPTGRTASSTASGTFLNSTFDFESVNGNLNSRKDVTRNLTENFTYDGLNRLTGYKNATISYNSLGNIISKSNAGTLGYDKYKVQTITPISGLSNTLSKQQDITYTSFMRPNSITENDYQATFSYNADNQRVKIQIKKGGNNYLTRYYLGNVYEIDNKVGETKEKLYFGGNYYDAYAVYVKQDGVWQLNYICRDYLGSITHITNSTGALLAEYSYDAWGRLRNPVNQSVYAPETEPELMLGRGYTGHEHLAVFGLVNMNARLYDPILGRFLSPDPYVLFLMKEQKKKIQLLLEEHFSQYGFKKKKLNNYIRIKDGNVIQDIGFTTTTHGERHVIYLNPVVGVIYKDVDEIMVQLREGTNSSLEMYTPMISLPIGYLMPDNDFKEWKFTIDKDVNEDIDNMARAIINYGLPYLEELSNMDQVIHGLVASQYSYIGEAKDYILPVLYYLHGNSEQALKTVEESIKKRSKDINIDEYRVMQAIYGEDAIQIPSNKALDSYMPFVEKFKQLLKQKK